LKQENVVHAGIPLKEDDLEKHRVLSLVYRPKTQYAWATGIAVGRFLTELKAGRIIGTKCKRCRRVVVPPRIFCEWCFRRTDEWVHLPDSGIVNTFSVSYISTDTTRLKTPIIPAVIEIDGTTKAGFLHMVGEVKPDEVKIGMRVKAVWREPTERTGSITDIKYFTPVKR
jgi:uncharacterized OB-fold protein